MILRTRGPQTTLSWRNKVMARTETLGHTPSQGEVCTKCKILQRALQEKPQLRQQLIDLTGRARETRNVGGTIFVYFCMIGEKPKLKVQVNGKSYEVEQGLVDDLQINMTWLEQLAA